MLIDGTNRFFYDFLTHTCPAESQVLYLGLLISLYEAIGPSLDLIIFTLSIPNGSMKKKMVEVILTSV